MRQNVCSKWLFLRKKFQWKIITITMSVLVVSFLLFLCVVYLRLVADTTYVLIEKKIWKQKYCFSVFLLFVLLFRKQILLTKSIWLFPDHYYRSRRRLMKFLKKKSKFYFGKKDMQKFLETLAYYLFFQIEKHKKLGRKNQNSLNTKTMNWWLHLHRLLHTR